MASNKSLPTLLPNNANEFSPKDDHELKQQPSPASSSGQRYPRHERHNTISSRASNSTSIPHESQVVDRILSLFHDPELVMRFSFETRSNPNVPFHRQGDLSTMPAEEKQARMQLLQNRAIRRAIDRIWNLFKFKDVRYGVSREQYTEFHQLVSRTLRSDSHDITQTQSVIFLALGPVIHMGCSRGVAARDWLHDCSSNHGIQLEAWRKSIFELVDLWELGSDHHSYVAFLDTLLSRIADPVSPLHIHKAIAKLWKPSATSNDAKLLRWALANVELKFRTLKDVPKTKLGPCHLLLYNADQELQDDINISPNDSPKPTEDIPVVSDSLPTRIDEKALARLEEFLTSNHIDQTAAEENVLDMVQLMAESRAQFSVCMRNYQRSMKICLESCCEDVTLTSQAELVRNIYEHSEKSQQRNKDRPQYDENVRKAVDLLQWDILTGNKFVQTVLVNETLPRMKLIWNPTSSS